MKPTLVITGGTRGLGRELSLVFAKNGYRVVALYQSNHVAAESLKEECEKKGWEIAITAFDLASGAGFALSHDDSEITFIHNACAPFSPKPFHLQDAHEILQGLGVSIVGAHNCLKGLLRPMVKQKRGIAVAILTAATESYPKGFSTYLAGKHALRALWKSLAREYGDLGIRFLTASPGFMETELTQHWDARLKQGMSQQLSPQQIARAIFDRCQNLDADFSELLFN